jgi:high affinity sulfate transporter 1
VGQTISRYVPIVKWLPAYSRRWLRADFVAGLTVVTMLLPEGVAYAELAGVPPEAAFSVAFAALLGYAIFGTSRQIVVAPTSTIAVMSAAAVAPLAAGATAEFIALSAVLAFLSGLLLVLLGVIRLGFIAEFFSKSIVTGFLFGIAITVALGQVPKLIGFEAEGGAFFHELWYLLTHLEEINSWTLLVGITSLALLFTLSRLPRRVPEALLVILYGIAMVSLLGLEERGVEVVGQVPAALPRLGLPVLRPSDVLGLLPGALGIVFVAYAQTIATAREFGAEHHYDVDPNQELVALGISNLGAGLVQGFAVGPSLSLSIDNDEAGARTQMSAFIAAALVLVTGVWLPPLLHNLPEATLGAIVIHAVWELMDVAELRRFYRIRKADFEVALAALLGVVILGVLEGLLVAIGLALLGLIYRASRPALSVLGRAPDGQSYAHVQRHPEHQTVPGLIIVRLDAPLFFANAVLLRDEIRKLVFAADPRPKAVLIDLEATSELDLSSADMLSELVTEMKTQGVAILLGRVHGPVLDFLHRSGVMEEIGDDHIFSTVDQGVQAFLAASNGDLKPGTLKPETYSS